MAKRVPKILYHYCSVDTFYNIIKNKSIWLSDISKSNDSLELQWLNKQCGTYVMKSWLTYLKELQKEDKLKTEDFKKVDMSKKWIEYMGNETSKCWVFCLSEKKDDLGQWRGYADDGMGLSIGFKADFFEIAESSDKGDAVFFGKVKYSKKEIEKFFEETAGLNTISTNDSSDDVEEKIFSAIWMTMRNSAFFKSEAFKDEKEWRIAYSMDMDKLAKGEIPGIPNDKNEFSNLVTFGGYGFSVKNKSLISHIELGIPHMEKVIPEIYIGPKSPLTIRDVKMFLISQGMLKDYQDKSIRVHKSEASYR
ncbi:MAG: DUF2971 domain-containing protein [Clostridia bacterium]|nr:DUF2971 domain-containing protein [Clostridia bacterium]